jgi:hypothetical protein
MPIERPFHIGKGSYKSWGEKMADGSFGPAGVATIHKDALGHTEVYRLPTVGPYFAKEEEAAEVAMQRLLAWGMENYPPT